MPKPRFSIVIPVYNREKRIETAIKCVLQQDFSSWEMILVDDGSTDGTASICRKHAEQDCRIRYVCQPNRGVSAARNVGIGCAQGEYILFLDSDDRISQEALEILNSCLNENPNIDIVCYGTESIAEKWTKEFGKNGKRIEVEEIRRAYLPTHISIYPRDKCFLLNYIWNKCYRSGFLRKNELLFDEQRRTWEDGIFVVNCLDKAKSIQVIPNILHFGCDDPNVEHLSSKVYKEQLRIYIQDETEFKRRFEDEYDFLNEYYCHSNFRVLNRLFASYVAVFKTAAKEMIEEALQEQIVAFWCEHVRPENDFEMRILNAMKCRNAGNIYAMYSTSFIRRIMRKLSNVLIRR